MEYKDGKLTVGVHVWTITNNKGTCTAACENLINDITLIIDFFKGANIFRYVTRHTITGENDDVNGVEWMGKYISREEIEQVQVALVMLYCGKLDN